jgi:hypothetical protein
MIQKIACQFLFVVFYSFILVVQNNGLLHDIFMHVYKVLRLYFFSLLVALNPFSPYEWSLYYSFLFEEKIIFYIWEKACNVCFSELGSENIDLQFHPFFCKPHDCSFWSLNNNTSLCIYALFYLSFQLLMGS